MGAPSIKGSAFAAVVEDLRGLVDAGRVSRAVLEARLPAADLAILDARVSPALWYPLASYARLCAVLLELEGGARPEAYVAQRGARAAERLFAAGLYLQLERGEALGAEKRERGEGWSVVEGNLVTSLAGAIFNVSRWRFEVDPRDARLHRIHVSEAADLPEVSRLAAQGFIEYTASRLAGVPLRVESERVAPDQIVFTLRLRAPR